MRVIFWSELFWPYIGGGQLFAARLLPALLERDHEIIIITSHGGLNLPDEDRWMNIPVHRFPFLQVLSRGDLTGIMTTKQRLTSIKRAFKADLVHVNLQDPSVYFHIGTTQIWPAPTLLTIHGELGNCQAGPGTLLGRALREADWITAVSQFLLDDLCKIAPDIRNKSSLVYNSVPQVHFKGPQPSADPPQVLCIGRLVPEKGFDLAIDAFAKIHTRHPEALLVIAGDGPERENLKRRAADWGITESVKFKGWVNPEDLNHFISEAILVLVPSRWREAFGLVALEAAVCARPVVATRVGALPEIVLDGKTGVLVTPGDSISMAATVLKLLRNPQLAVTLGISARQNAKKHFDFQKHVNCYHSLYRRLATAGGINRERRTELDNS